MKTLCFTAFFKSESQKHNTKLRSDLKNAVKHNVMLYVFVFFFCDVFKSHAWYRNSVKHSGI